MSVEIEEYLSFSHKINELISAHMLGLNLTVKDYKFIYLWDEIIKGNVKLRSFCFERCARRSISGMIIKDEYEVTIVYNGNMSEKRVNFTVSHEIVHYLFHLNDIDNFFTDTKDSLEYSSLDMLPEFQANIGSSAILIPDPVLIHELKAGSAPYQISNKYGISENALYIRLVQQMQANFGAHYHAASRAANKIMSGQSKKSMIDLGANLENKHIYTNPFYEALCI